ncbi:hypothetical protein REPUB_Repub01dG0060600 [Reevesia pubescens]
MSSLTGKMEASVEIKASAEMFHDLMFNRPHHVSNACPDKVQACDLHYGGWGKHGSIVCWSYFHGKIQRYNQEIELADGKAKIAKNLVTFDPKTNTISHRVLEGDLAEEYKNFIAHIQATPSAKGKGSVVHLVVEYEKLNENVPNPDSMVEFLIGMFKAMGSHLSQP